MKQLPQNRAPLKDVGFTSIPTGAIKPKGWLKDQMMLQKNGLTGHIEDVWESVGSYSGWLGGTGESWERGPYYLDGLIPLAYQLDDETLKNRAQKWIEWTLSSQVESGWYGPENNPDWWPRMVMNKVLIQYCEATDDERVIPFLTRYFSYQFRHLSERPLIDWGKARAGDNLYAIFWLYNITGDDYLIDLARMVYGQGFDWSEYFQNIPFTHPTEVYYKWEQMKDHSAIVLFEKMNCFSTHTVNIAMGVKTPVLYSQIDDDSSHIENVRKGIEDIMNFHGLPMGIWSGDEHLNGNSPSRGAELCSVNELLFSLEENVRVSGDIATADHIEKLIYNALPGTLDYKLETHQYDQMANQIMVNVADHGFYNNDPDANLFGLEPNFGCCTANMHQGWPKFVSHMFMKSGDDGLCLLLYGPATTCFTTVDGHEVTVSQVTDYPFSDTVNIKIFSENQVVFPLQMRIPNWCHSAQISYDGSQFTAEAGTFFTVNYAGTGIGEISLKLPMEVKTSFWGNNSVAVERGPLLYSLKIREKWEQIGGKAPFCDYRITGESDWQYTLALDKDLSPVSCHVVETGNIPRQPFSPSGSPVKIIVDAYLFPDWEKENDTALPPPVSPVVHSGEPVQIELVPYAATKLRITCFPYTQV